MEVAPDGYDDLLASLRAIVYSRLFLNLTMHYLRRSEDKMRTIISSLVLAMICLVNSPHLLADNPISSGALNPANGHWYQLSPRPVNGLDDAIQLSRADPL